MTRTILLLCAIASSHFQTGQTPQQKLALDFLQAINTKELGTIQSFMEQRGASTPPPAERAKRILGIAQQGAPFEFVKFGPETSNRVLLLVSDRNRMPVTFQIQVIGDEPKLESIRVTPGDTTNAKPPRDYLQWTSLSELVRAVCRDTDCPALGVAVIRDGKMERSITGTREIGKSDPVPVDAPWSIGSIGKSLCSTIVGKLVEQGRLRWNMTVAEAMPGVPMNSGYASVTLEQIMRHRGGFPQDLGFRRPEIERIVAGATTPREVRAHYIRDILSRDPIAPPDTRFAYSNAGYAFLAHVVEERMNQPYEEILRRTVFRPLGLEHSYIGVETLPGTTPMGHLDQDGQLRPAMMRGPLESMMAGAGGGIYMSVSDLARYGQMHLNGLRGKNGLLRATTIARLHRGIPEDAGAPNLYACGWGIERYPGIQTSHGHNGSNGTFRAELAIFPESNLVVTAISNRGGETDPSPPLQAVLAIAGRFAKSKD